jgi:hypothetical protein
MRNWRTQVDPDLTAAFGRAEIHCVFFQPVDDTGGTRTSVILQIPEASRQGSCPRPWCRSVGYIGASGVARPGGVRLPRPAG